MYCAAISISSFLGVASLLSFVGTAHALPSFSDSSVLRIGKRTFVNDACTEEQFNDFGRDYSLGMGYVDRVSGLVNKDNPTWQMYFGASYHDDATVKEYQDNYLYGYIPLGSDTNFEVKVRCGNDKDVACTQTPPGAPAGQVAYAVTVNNHDFVLCDPFFDLPDPEVNGAQWCTEQDRVIGEFETGSFVLLHEVGHLAYKLDEPLVDHVWCDGTACVDLARDDEDAALENADNWAFAALHVYWNDRCGRDIPILTA